MTTPSRGTHAGAPFGVMARGALIPSLGVGLVTVAIVVAVRGWGALGGSLFGLIVALGFFGLGMLVLSKLIREANMHLFFAIAMTVYLGQVIGLLLVILVVRKAEWVDRPAMAIVIAVVTILWQVFAIRALRTARIPIYDEPAPVADHDPEEGPR